MSTVYILVGIPGSGKSTYARSICDGKETFRVNKDDIRACMGKTVRYVPASETIYHNAMMAIVRSLVQADKNVVIDNTNLNPGTLRNLIHKLDRMPVTRLILVVMKDSADLQLCLERNNKRSQESYVPEQVILDMHEKFKNFDANKYDVDHVEYV